MELRKALEAIPEIYRAFEVYVLLPGSPCGCFEGADRFAKSVKDGETEVNLHEELRKWLCWSFLAVYGWSIRIWTRQEMLYARKVRFVWTGATKLDCDAKMKDTANEHGLRSSLSDLDSPWSRPEKLWHHRYRNKVNVRLRRLDESLQARAHICSSTTYDGPKGFSEQLKIIAQSGLQEFEQTLTSWMATRRTSGPLDQPSVVDAKLAAHRWMFALLSGQEMISPQWESESRLQSLNADSDGLARFLFDFSYFKDTARRANKRQDYVLAFWVDCPIYRVPSGYHRMSLGELLEDALAQLDQKAGIRLASHLPGFLFGDLPHAHVWKPGAYIDSQPIGKVSDVYSCLAPFPNHFYSSNVPVNGALQAVVYFKSPGRLTNTLGFGSRMSWSKWFKTAFQCTQDQQLACLPGQNWAFLFIIRETWARFPSSRLAQSERHSWRGDVMYKDDSKTPDDVICELLVSETHDLLSTELQELSKGSSDVDLIRKLLESRLRHLNTPLDDIKVDLDEVAFKMTCRALGISPDAAEASGLRLMVRETPPMLGLTRRRLTPGLFLQPRRCTVSLSPAQWNESTDQLEVRLAGDDVLLYEADLPAWKLFRYIDNRGKTTAASRDHLKSNDHLESNFNGDNLVGIWVYPGAQSVTGSFDRMSVLVYSKCGEAPKEIYKKKFEPANPQKASPSFFKVGYGLEK